MEKNEASVREFIDAVPGDRRRRDAETLLELFGRITGKPPIMWGPTSVGFGEYHYKYPSGREGDAGAAGFAPRKASTVVYLPDGVGAYAEQLSRLGEHTTGVVCVYIKDLTKVDLDVLEEIVAESYRTITSATYEHRAHFTDGGRPTSSTD